MANVLYDDIGRAIHSMKPPVKGLTIDVVTHPQYLSLRVYEEEILQYNDGQREAIMKHLLMMRDVVQAFGVRCEIDGGKYVPRRI